MNREWRAYNPNQPIKALYMQMNQAVNFSGADSNLFTESQIVATAYNLIFKTGLYNETCHKYRRRLQTDET